MKHKINPKHPQCARSNVTDEDNQYNLQKPCQYITRYMHLKVSTMNYKAYNYASIPPYYT
jgi:hypothetical protein